MYVLDATPLIYLAKIERLELLEALSESPLVPEPVHEEVVTRGLEEGHPDARRVERALEEGVLERVDVPDTGTFHRLGDNDRLSDADAAVLAVADHRDGTAIVDEQYGRDVAATASIPTRGTAYLVLWLLAEDHLGAAEATDIIDAMVEEGWYCSTDVYSSIRRKIDELARG